MTELFLGFVNRSYAACFLIAAVLLLRLVLKNAPKRVRPVLWSLVGLRLALPFTLESALSLIPAAAPLAAQDVQLSAAPAVTTGIPALNQAVNSALTAPNAAASAAGGHPLFVWTDAAALVWLTGAGVLLGYLLVSALRVRAQVRTAVRLYENVYACDAVSSPFVFGVFRPRIYLPSGMNAAQARLVLAHERMHIRRGDHLVKLAGFVLLALYWFHPLVWLSYVLLCRDIELACDEQVIRGLDAPSRADYSQALLACSTPRRTIAVCPLAFGEVGVKTRVKAVLNYKKPAFLLIVLAVVCCIALCICFLTDPKINTHAALSSGAYLVESGNLLGGPCVIFNAAEQRFTFTSDLLSSYLAHGSFTMENGNVLCTTDDGVYTYRFRILDNDTIAFVSSGSSEVRVRRLAEKDTMPLPDGARFVSQQPDHIGLNAVVLHVDAAANTITVADIDANAGIFGKSTVLACEYAELLWLDAEADELHTLALDDLRGGDEVTVSLTDADYRQVLSGGSASAVSVQLQTQRVPASAQAQQLAENVSAQYPAANSYDESGFSFHALSSGPALLYPYRLTSENGGTLACRLTYAPTGQDVVLILVCISKNSGPEVQANALLNGGDGTVTFDVPKGGSYYLFLIAVDYNTQAVTGAVHLAPDGVQLTPIGEN